MALLLVLVAGTGCKGEKPAAQQGPPPAVVVAEVVRQPIRYEQFARDYAGALR